MLNIQPSPIMPVLEYAANIAYKIRILIIIGINVVITDLILSHNDAVGTPTTFNLLSPSLNTLG
ncbi:Uncharacterised protein [Chlamydia abortus]|nr:Uncharacterised protein [Chlamydia abortus]